MITQRKPVPSQHKATYLANLFIADTRKWSLSQPRASELNGYTDILSCGIACRVYFRNKDLVKVLFQSKLSKDALGVITISEGEVTFRFIIVDRP